MSTYPAADTYPGSDVYPGLDLGGGEDPDPIPYGHIYPGSDVYPGVDLIPGESGGAGSIDMLYPGADVYPGTDVYPGETPGGVPGQAASAALTSSSSLTSSVLAQVVNVSMQATSTLSGRMTTHARAAWYAFSIFRAAPNSTRHLVSAELNSIHFLQILSQRGRGIAGSAVFTSRHTLTAVATVVIPFDPNLPVPTFDLTLAEPIHQVITVVELLVPGQPAIRLPVTGGTINADAGAAIRRRLEGLTVADPTLVPTEDDDYLQPLQNEIRVRRGLRFSDGTEELHPLGVFGIYETSVQDSSVPQITLNGYDRSAAVRDNRWTAPWKVDAGTDAAAAIKAIILDRFPAAQFVFPSSVGYTLPNLLFGASSRNDPWADARELATAAAHDLNVNPAGQFELRPIADADTQPPLWALLDGAGGTLTGINRRLTRERSYTRVIARQDGTGLSAPLHSEAFVSSTRPRPYFYKATGVTSQAQLDAVAQALLERHKGAFSTVSFEAIPDPRIDVGTVGEVRRVDIGVVGKHVLETLSIPLGLGPMSGSLRGQNS